MFWHLSVHQSIHLSVHTGGGGGGTRRGPAGGGVHYWGCTWGYPAGGYPVSGGYPAGGEPAEEVGGTLPGGTWPGGVVPMRRAVCLLPSRRRTFLFSVLINSQCVISCGETDSPVSPPPPPIPQFSSDVTPVWLTLFKGKAVPIPYEKQSPALPGRRAVLHFKLPRPGYHTLPWLTGIVHLHNKAITKFL